MLSVVLIGTGNVARHLFDAIHAISTFDIVQVAGRSSSALEYFRPSVRVSDNFDSLTEAEIYLLAVSDDSIAELSATMSHLNGLVVHTSGSVAMEDLPDSVRRGVFYPLQTFTKDIEVDFRTVPICIEAEHEDDYKTLELLGRALSNEVHSISSIQRRQLHLGAVFVNNFVNHLYTIGHDICQEQGLSFDILKPLIRETARKIETIAPAEAQTGPARRYDNKTMDLQKARLNNDLYRQIYSAISKSILSTYGEKL